MSTIKELVNQTAIYGLSSVLGRLLNYLLVPLYTRVFIPEEYGVVIELYAYVAFLVVFLTYGLETAYFRFVKKTKQHQLVYSTSLISLIVSSAVFLCIIFTYSEQIGSLLGYYNNYQYIEWLAIIVAIDAVSSISLARLRNENKAVRFTIIRLINITVNISLNLYFVLYRNYGIEYVFISNLISSAIMIFLLFPQMLDIKWKFNKDLWKKMMIYAIPLLFAGLAGITNETIDRILLKHLSSNSQNTISEIGLYGAFYKLSIIMTLFIQTFRYAAEPFFFKHNSISNNKSIYADIMNFFVIVMAIIFLTVTIFYDHVVMFLGQEYHDKRGFLVVSILLLANFFLGIYYNLSIWYKLTEKTIYGAYLSFLGVIITLSLNFLLIPFFGFVGSAWATLACYFSMTIASYFLGKVFFPVPYKIKKISVYFSIMLTIYLCVYFLNINKLTSVLLLFLFIILVVVLEKKNFIKNYKK